LRCVSGTEQQLTPANDISFRDQVIQTDQFFLPALGPLMLAISGGRILFVVSCVHFRLPINTICATLFEAFFKANMSQCKYLQISGL
jgi:hypothetical protein